MVAFTSEGRDYLHIVGGRGPPPNQHQLNAEYHHGMIELEQMSNIYAVLLLVSYYNYCFKCTL